MIKKSDTKSVPCKAKLVKTEKKEKRCDSKCRSSSSCGGPVYGLGFIGAAIYFISIATSFWMGMFGVLKAIVWPALLMLELLKFLGV